MGIIETIKKIAKEESAEQKTYEFVKNLILNTDFDNAKIASLAGVPETFVEKVKKEVNK